jgi:hypothetical protein
MACQKFTVASLNMFAVLNCLLRSSSGDGLKIKGGTRKKGLNKVERSRCYAPRHFLPLACGVRAEKMA